MATDPGSTVSAGRGVAERGVAERGVDEGGVNERAVSRRSWPDVVPAVVVLTLAVAEVVLRDGRPLALAVGAVVSGAVLARRVRPLPAVLGGFGAVLVFDLAAFLTESRPFSLVAGVGLLLLVHALFRYGTTRQSVVGSPVVVAMWVLTTTTDPTGPADAAGGLVVLLLAAAVGLAARYRQLARTRLVGQVRLQERVVLARDLHDTVAHHVSAIAVQAQAGQLLARAGDVDRAQEALSVIEAEASRALREMRSIVGTLRHDDSGPAPEVRHGLADLEALGDMDDAADGADGAGARVVVQRRGDLDDVAPAVQAALYRVAQEAVTNARRHARHASRVEVVVDGTGPEVQLSVRDDGDPTGGVRRGAPGYGLLGMRERIGLLGGSVEAGPGPDGWAVRATVPRRGGPA